MSERTTATATGGPGCATLLLVLFVGLKLTGHIGWSWWWVLAPAWIPALIAALVLLVTLIWAVKQ